MSTPLLAGDPPVKLYPVPLSGNILNVSVQMTELQGARTVELRNFIGRELQEKQIPGSSLVSFEDMSAYPDGVYVILIRNGANKILYSTKFIIKK